MIFEHYRDDLKTRPEFPSHTFTETPVFSETLVEFKDASGNVIGSAQNIERDDAYRAIREDLVALRSEVMITVTEVQRDAWTGTPHTGEGPIFNTDGGAELFDGTNWVPV